MVNVYTMFKGLNTCIPSRN